MTATRVTAKIARHTLPMFLITQLGTQSASIVVWFLNLASSIKLPNGELLAMMIMLTTMMIPTALAVSNPLLNHATLTTIISKPAAKGTSTDHFAISKNWLANRQSNPDRALILGFETLETMASGLGLVPLIKDRACEIYKKVQEQKSCTPRNREAMSAACLFISCRENKLPRTLKEICSPGGVTMKDINKAVQVIKKNVELEDMTAGTTNPTELLVRRFCSNLGMKNHAMKAVRESFAKIQEIDIRRNPKSVLAAIIYIITQLSDEKKPLGEVSVAADVAQGTIKNSCKDIYPHASRLIPNWYAKEEDIKRLCIF